MDYRIDQQQDHVTLFLEGELTFSDSEKFGDVLQKLEDAPCNACEVDFKGLTFIDSAGLRMLLLLHNLSKNNGFNLSFVAPTGDVRDRLLGVKFDTIVSMDGTAP